MKPPVQENEFQPPVDVVRFLEPLHQSRLPFHEVVESFKRVVVRAHVGVVVMGEEEVEVPLEHADDFRDCRPPCQGRIHWKA